MRVRSILTSVLAYVIFQSTTVYAMFGGVMVGSGNKVIFDNGVNFTLPAQWVPFLDGAEVKVTSDETKLETTVSFENSEFGTEQGAAEGFVIDAEFVVTQVLELSNFTVVVKTNTSNTENYIRKIYNVKPREQSVRSLRFKAVFGSQIDEQDFEAMLPTLTTTVE